MRDLFGGDYIQNSLFVGVGGGDRNSSENNVVSSGDGRSDIVIARLGLI